MVYNSEKLTSEEVAELEEFYNIKLPDKTNSLYKEIKEILYCSKQLEDPDAFNPQSHFNTPATEKEIADWEKENDITLPEQYKEWLRFSNGSEICDILAQFWSIQELSTNCPYVPEKLVDLVGIGWLIGDGELLCFSKTTRKFVCYFQGKESRNYDLIEILTDTIIEIMQKDLL